MTMNEIQVLLIETDIEIARKIEALLHERDEVARFKVRVLNSLEDIQKDKFDYYVDVVLMDLDSRKLFWLQTIQTLRIRQPDIPIIVFTSEEKSEMIKKASQMGIAECLSHETLMDSCCLSKTLKYVAKQAQLEKQLIQAQKMESVGHLAGGIAHDFNNLLSVINGYSELVISTMNTNSENYESMREIKMAGERATNLTRQLLTFSRQQITQPKVVNVNELILHLDKMLRRLIGDDVEFVILPTQEPSFILIDSTQMETILMNLVINARDAMPSGGKLVIELKQVTFDHEYSGYPDKISVGDYVMISVTDTGIGMTDEVKRQILKPFYSTKEEGKGTGLGLVTCYEIIKLGQGAMDIYSEVGYGTTFKIYLPKVIDFQNEEEIQKKNVIPQGSGTIMLVEDELSVRGLARHILTQNGYKVLEATNGEEAFITLQHNSACPVDLLITDMIMPLMGGVQLVERLAEIRPEIKVLFISGYPDKLINQNNEGEDKVHFLQKPFSKQSLLSAVHAMMNDSSTDRKAA